MHRQLPRPRAGRAARPCVRAHRRRAACSSGHGYDDLAVLRAAYLAEQGRIAVDGFARDRVPNLLAEHLRATSAACPAGGAGALARVLTPAATPPRPGGRARRQLCQHHCPVAHVAAEFPELCEAETQAFVEMLGTHVQRLDTIARGDAACTTHVPLRSRSRRGGTSTDTTTVPKGGSYEGHHAPEEHELTQEETLATLGRYDFGWSDPDAAAPPARGLSADVVADISALKNEPQWMLDFRLKALGLFESKPMPRWVPTCPGSTSTTSSTSCAPPRSRPPAGTTCRPDIKNTYDKLGIPEAEKARLVAGVAAQYESEVVYHQIREDLEEQGVIFLDTDTGLREHPELFREYFGSVIPSGDNKFSALNSAVWSGGSFIYVPPGVHVDIPLQAYFRINTENMGQFERTLIIVDEVRTCTTSRAARRRSTSPTRCTPRSSRSS